jgi:serine/threonine protein kinase
MEDFVNELEILASLRHPNIVLMMGAVVEENRLAIVSEVCILGVVGLTCDRNVVLCERLDA